MAATLKASEQGLAIIDKLRRKKGWAKKDKAWYGLANISESTLGRFWKREPITQEIFVNICTVIGANWEEIYEDSDAQLLEQKNISEHNDHNTSPRGMYIPHSRCRRVWGRENLIEQTLDRLTDPQQPYILSLSGSAGYGKTEAACEVAKAALQRNLFVDVLWVKARDTELVDNHITQSQRDETLNWKKFLHEIAHQLDKCPVDQVHQRLREEKRLIILDNAETAQTEDILANLVEMLNPSRTLLTSRMKTTAPYVALMGIEGLQPHWSYKLLQDEAESKNIPALLKASTTQLEQVHKLTCGAPLALHFIIGRVLDDQALEPVLLALEEASGDVEKFYEFSLQTAWERISNTAKNLLRYMGDCDASVTWEELSGTKQVQESGGITARRELRRWYLIEEDQDIKGNQRYNLHPWVRRSLRKGLVDKWSRSLEEWKQIAQWKYGL
jgi:hypothetical protein